ncbi:MAG: hypothetical protein J6S85_02790 [Methanobrevibacter sp.]|nr:hypothetical protein [Methanobrevibacter sp.]MBO7712467.1 hypothetical protein [Methanobrevibacter sp.]
MEKEEFIKKISKPKDKWSNFYYEDCAGFSKLETGVKCLRKKRCKCENCTFYQSRSDYEKVLEKCRKRLASLPYEEQQYIANEYYEGRFVWLNKEVKK